MHQDGSAQVLGERPYFNTPAVRARDDTDTVMLLRCSTGTMAASVACSMRGTHLVLQATDVL